MVRWSRKEGVCFVMTESEPGKASGWSAWYTDGKWNVQEKAKKAAAKKKASKKKVTKPAPEIETA